MKFPVIVADPPWQFTTYSDKGKEKSPEQHYPTLSLADIAALPVDRVATDDAILFLWVYNPMLFDSKVVIDSWGFTFKSIGFNWVKKTVTGKNAFGLGYWTRQSTELCLIATRGSPERFSKSVRQFLETREPEVMETVLGRHSEKPDEVRYRIEELVNGPYLELFCRRPRAGWVSVGDELTQEDMTVSLDRLHKQAHEPEGLFR